MNRPLSFMGANLYGQQTGFTATVEDWGRGDRTTRAWFEPEETCAARYEEFFADVAARGFTHVDLWGAQYMATWATPTHLAAIQDSVARHGLTIASYAGGPYGEDTAQMELICASMARLGVRILGGYSAVYHRDRPAAVRLLEQYDQVFAWENHPEPDAATILAKVGEVTPHTGVCVDTGWFETQGMPAGRAIRELGDAVAYVHLKDVRAVGAHQTCALGDGVLDLDDTLAALDDIGYTGAVSIEHEADGYDPRPEVELSRDRVLAWWAAR